MLEVRAIMIRRSLGIVVALATATSLLAVAIGFPGALFNVLWGSLFFLGPLASVVVGWITGSQGVRRSVLALAAIGLIPGLALIMTLWLGLALGTEHASDQAITNAGVAVAFFVVLDPIACIVLGLVAELAGWSWRRSRSGSGE